MHKISKSILEQIDRRRHKARICTAYIKYSHVTSRHRQYVSIVCSYSSTCKLHSLNTNRLSSKNKNQNVYILATALTTKFRSQRNERTWNAISRGPYWWLQQQQQRRWRHIVWRWWRTWRHAIPWLVPGSHVLSGQGRL